MKRRILSLAMSLAIVASISATFPAVASAASCSGNSYIYVASQTQVQSSGYDSCNSPLRIGIRVWLMQRNSSGTYVGIYSEANFASGPVTFINKIYFRAVSSNHYYRTLTDYYVWSGSVWQYTGSSISSAVYLS